MQLPCGQYPSTAVRFSPLLYLLHPNKVQKKNFFLFTLLTFVWKTVAIDLPYRMVFAVGTTDSHVVIYDTQLLEPLVHISGIHYEPINDLAWSEDGRTLVVSRFVWVETFA